MRAAASAAVLDFDPERHAYRLDGAPVPSVTQVLEPYTGLEFVDRRVLEAASEFGRHVHAACHLDNLGALDEAALDPALAPYVGAWRAFLADTGAVVAASERRVASRCHRYAGTLDTLVEWDARRALVDLKSTASVPRTVGPQTAAYAEAYTEETGERVARRYCVHLRGDGTYRVHRLAEPADWTVFLSCLNVHRWYYQRNGRAHR